MIKVTGLSRRFGDFTAVDKITFRVEPGQVLGFLGPNGAGKSTTMKMITGFLEPSAGAIEVCGINVLEQRVAAQRLMGYLPEGAPAWSDMTVAAFLRFIAQVRGYRGAELRARIDQVVRQVELQDMLERRIENLSKGFKRRVGLAQAILHDPKVLILDEPTDGLDPNQKHQVRRLIRELAKDRILVISTHILEEVHAVCTRALIIANGRVVADGTPDELAARSPYHRSIRLRFAGSEDLAVRVARLRELADVSAVESGGHARELRVVPRAGASILHSVNQLIHQQGWDVEDFHVETGRLEDVFRQITTGVQV
mgnify:CR=1 FL=1